MEGRNDRIAAFRREFRGETIWVVHNLSGSAEAITLETSNAGGFKEVLTGKPYEKQNQRLFLQLQPYQFLWLEEKSASK